MVTQQLPNLDDQYVRDNLIAQGADSRVYLGHKKNASTEEVAIKVFHSKEHFDREWTALRLLGGHPNIITYKNAGVIYEYEGVNKIASYCIVLEYISGGNLKQRDKKERDEKERDKHEERVDLQTVVERVEDLANGLDHAHKNGIFHHDVQPENMLYDELRGCVRLIDFARCTFPSYDSNPLDHTVGGHRKYLAPELYNRGPTDADRYAASDQFSLAVVACEWLIGSQNLDELDLQGKQIVDRMMQDVELPSPIKQVLSKAGAPDYKDRYQDILSFALALRNAYNTASRHGRQIERRTLISIGLTTSILALIVGGSIALYEFSGNKEDSPSTQPATVYTSDKGPISDLAISPDKRKTAVLSNDHRTIAILDTTSYHELYTYNAPGQSSISSNEWYKDSQHMFLAVTGKNVYYWDTSNRKTQKLSLPSSTQNSSDLTFARLSPQSNNQLAVTLGGQVYVADTAQWLQNMPPPSALPFEDDNDSDDQIIIDCAWSPDEQFFAALYENQVRIWELATGTNSTIPITATSGSKIAWRPKSTSLTIGKSDGTVETRSLNNEMSLPALSTGNHSIVALSWSPDGRYLAIANAQPLTWLLDFAQPDAPRRQELLPGKSVRAFAWSLDQGHLSLSIGCTDSTLRILRFS